MKAATIPFPREFGPSARGKDVRAVKRALRKAGETGMADNGIFGSRAQRELADFKQKHGLLHDPFYTPQAHAKLLRFFDEFGAHLMAQAAAEIARQHLVDTFVQARRWMVAHRSLFGYAEVRPIPEYLQPFETTRRIETDCSGSIELAARWAGCPDPSKLGFNGAGNTGTLLAACHHITAAQAAAADLIVYRSGSRDQYGHHAVSIDSRAGADFNVVSHGHSGDPGEYLHSAMQASQARAGYPDAVFLRFL